MPRLLLISVLILLLCVSLFAQEKVNSACPTIMLTGPNGLVRPSVDMEIGVDLKPTHSANLRYHWSANAGSIIEGQGTPNIRIATDHLGGEEIVVIKVTVRIEGLPVGCESSASDDYGIAAKIGEAFPLDEYESISFSDEKQRIDNLAIQVLRTTNTAYIVKYFVSGASAEIIRNVVSRVEQQLLSRGLPRGRFVILTYRSERARTLLWSQPPGTTPPLPSCPTIRVVGPQDIVKRGELMTFTAEFLGDVSTDVTYSWILSSGEIVSGQGTAEIKVRGPASRGTNVTATVEIRGLPERCPDSESETAPECSCPVPIIVDEYDISAFNLEKIQIDRALDLLKTHPGKLLFITYGPEGQSSRINEAIRRLKNYLLEDRLLPVEKFEIVAAVGPREFTKIYIVPEGADNPIP